MQFLQIPWAQRSGLTERACGQHADPSITMEVPQGPPLASAALPPDREARRGSNLPLIQAVSLRDGLLEDSDHPFGVAGAQLEFDGELAAIHVH